MTGQALKEEAFDSMETTAEDFLLSMRIAAHVIDAAMGRVSIDDLRDYAERHNIHPPHQNCWGTIFRPQLGWKCIGRKKSRRASNHGREVRVWTREG